MPSTRSLVAAAILAAAAAVVVPSTAAAQLEFSSVSAWKAWSEENGFTKRFGATTRWGDRNTWEMAIRDGDDRGIGAEANHAWSPAEQDFMFTYDPTAVYSAALMASGDNTTTVQADVGNLVGDNPVNTIFFHGRASEGNTAVLSYWIESLDGTALFGSALDRQTFSGGDGPLLFGIQNAAFADGFRIRGTLTMATTPGATTRDQDPAINFKFGDSEMTEVVPEPATVILLATGLLGLLGMGWLRRRET